MLTTTMPDGTSVVNTYNGEGIRVKKEINGQGTKYLYQADQIILEIDTQGIILREIFGNSLIQGQ
jgi:hypothetical protein